MTQNYHSNRQYFFFMNKQLNANTTLIQIRVEIDHCGKIVSEFVRKHFGSDEFTTLSEHQHLRKIVMGFGYKIDGYPREVGHIHYKWDLDLAVCWVVINEFARKRFMEHLETSDVVYRVMKG